MKQFLIQIKALILDPKHWTQGEAARADDGYSIGATSVAAVCWCLVGAVQKIVPHTDEDYERCKIFNHLQKEVATMLPDRSIAEFNDCSTHEQVLQLLDKAIEHADAT